MSMEWTLAGQKFNSGLQHVNQFIVDFIQEWGKHVQLII